MAQENRLELRAKLYQVTESNVSKSMCGKQGVLRRTSSLMSGLLVACGSSAVDWSGHRPFLQTEDEAFRL